MHGRPREALLVAALVAAAAFLATACEPLYILPGGELSGTEHPAPDDWTFAEAEQVVQLEVRPADPYSVNVWGVGVGRHFYLGSSSAPKWTRAMEEDPLVRLRVAGRIYPLSAALVTDTAEIDAVVAAYVAKYDVDPAEEQVAAMFRLSAR